MVVIGGGNVSMDAVRTAKRLGAKKVSIVYRRRVADMTALPGEIRRSSCGRHRITDAESTGIYRCRRESSCKRYLCDTSDGKLDQRWKSKYQTYR